jgi:hypothetical protein
MGLESTGTEILRSMLENNARPIPRTRVLEDINSYVYDFLERVNGSFPAVIVRDLKRETGRTSKGF